MDSTDHSRASEGSQEARQSWSNQENAFTEHGGELGLKEGRSSVESDGSDLTEMTSVTQVKERESTCTLIKEF